MSDQQRFDASLKELIEFDPESWLRFIGVYDRPFSLIDADLSTVTAEADKVFRIGGDRSYLVHLEVQASRDPSMALRMARYNVMLNYRHGLPTRSVLILLRREAEDRSLSGSLEIGLPDRPSHLTFRYEVIRLWETPPETILESGLGLVPLAPLGRGDASALARILDLMDARVIRIASPSDLDLLRAATTILMSLKYTQEQIMGALSSVGFEDSWLYKEIFARGEAKGGRKALIDGLASYGSVNWGAPSAEILGELDKIATSVLLKKLYPRLSQAKSWEDLLRFSREESKQTNSP